MFCIGSHYYHRIDIPPIYSAFLFQQVMEDLSFRIKNKRTCFSHALCHKQSSDHFGSIHSQGYGYSPTKEIFCGLFSMMLAVGQTMLCFI